MTPAGRKGRPRPAPDDPESVDAAYEAAVRRLARQPQSRNMLARRLVQAGFSDGAVEAALDRAQTHGYLDDHAYAQALVQRRTPTRGRSLMAQELHSQGLPPDAVGSALKQVSEGDEAAQARALAIRLFVRTRPTTPAEVRARIGPKLGRRGYPAGLIHRICQELADRLGRPDAFDTPSEGD